MKSKRRYAKNDKVLVRSFASPTVCVRLLSRHVAAKSELKLGVDGWNAQITCHREVDKLRAAGVPYKKGEKPHVWVFDWQIIKKCGNKKSKKC